MKNKYLWSGLIAFSVVVLDQATKYLVMRYIPGRSVVRIIPGFFDLINVRNPGAAFGILSGDHGAWRRAFFVLVTLVALSVIGVMIKKSGERLLVIALSLIAGGAIGNNLIDRVRFGEVVDFIEWYYRSYHWPTFNIADSAISVGVGLLVVDMFLKKPKGTEKPV